MYWVKNKAGDYELLDGQQRALSICEFAGGDLRVDGSLMDNLTEAEQAQLLDYPLIFISAKAASARRWTGFESSTSRAKN